MPTTVPTSSFLSSSSARTAQSSSSAAATIGNFILPALWASAQRSVRLQSRSPATGCSPGARRRSDLRATEAPRVRRSHETGSKEVWQEQAAALTSRSRKGRSSGHCCLGQCGARRRRLGLYTLPPAPSWRPPIGEGASRWRTLIGPCHQAGRCRFEAASSATYVTATPPGLTHWLLVTLNGRQ